MTDTNELAAYLGETERQPIGLIGRIARRIGHNAAYDIAQRARQIEAGDGMLTGDGSRKRTAGGIFFVLVKEYLVTNGQTDVVEQLFPPRQRRRKAANAAAPRAAAPTRQPEIPRTPSGMPEPTEQLRPRMRRAGAVVAPALVPERPEPAAELPQPVAAGRLEANVALILARQLLPPETGAYAIGAHQERGALTVRLAFPDVAAPRHAEAIAQLAERSGWSVEIHPKPHQGQLIDAARDALPENAELSGPPSLRERTKQVRLRLVAPLDAAAVAAAAAQFGERTGWSLEIA